MADENKNFLALLTGITKRTYYGVEGISDELLKNEIYPDMDESQFSGMLNKATLTIKSMASVDMDFNQLEAFLSSQLKKKSENALTDDQAKVLTKFWKTHRGKIHDHLVRESSWGKKLRNFNCRVDVKNQSRHEDDIGTPTVVVELHAGHQGKKAQVVRFEMDDAQLNQIIKDMQCLEKRIEDYCQNKEK